MTVRNRLTPEEPNGLATVGPRNAAKMLFFPTVTSPIEDAARMLFRVLYGCMDAKALEPHMETLLSHPKLSELYNAACEFLPELGLPPVNQCDLLDQVPKNSISG